MNNQEEIVKLQNQLNHFNPSIRRAAIEGLMRKVSLGEIKLPKPGSFLNMHCHTFFSFNAYGHSPTSLAWLGKALSFQLMGIVDFDVLDGVDEFLDACDLTDLRGTAGIETRVFIPEYTHLEFNSPGEPGVAYHMGIGFSTGKIPDSASIILADLRNRAENRNRVVIERVNAYLDPVKIDYEEDVVPLTPAGSPTERHIVYAYLDKVEKQQSDPALFWSKKLEIELDKSKELLNDSARLQNQVRSKLIKQGGPGYISPTAETFPSIEEFHQLIQDSLALPCFAWLDGTSSGEQSLPEMLELFIQKGVAAINIIPDRNWNISDPEVRQIKLKNLQDAIKYANEFSLPINVGTEMNSFGQKFVDDFHTPDLLPFFQNFLDGAYFVYGHTQLQRGLGIGFQSEWAKSFMPERKWRNQFYTSVGKLIPPGENGKQKLLKLNHEMTPSEIFIVLNEGNNYG